MANIYINRASALVLGNSHPYPDDAVAALCPPGQPSIFTLIRQQVSAAGPHEEIN